MVVGVNIEPSKWSVGLALPLGVVPLVSATPVLGSGPGSADFGLWI